MDVYIKLLQQCRSNHERALWRGVTRQQLERRYDDLFAGFRRWMTNLSVPIREVRQDLAVWRVIEPLFDGFETAWMEVGWQDFLMAEKILLKIRGSDQLRAARLAVAAQADDAVQKAAAGEERDAALLHREAVYQEQGIPPSYLLGIPSTAS
jgi:hypothetical protein